MNSPERILILDGETNQALACARALGRAGSPASGYPVMVASHRRWPLAGWSRTCRDRFRLPGPTVEAYAALRGWARRRGVGIVLPLTERSCRLCNLERSAWEEHGIRIGCAADTILQRAFDKAETMRRAGSCGVYIPMTRFPGSLEECRAAAEELGFPCVIKPRFSHAWEQACGGAGGHFLPDRGVAYVSRKEDLDAAVLARKQGDQWPLLQQIAPGQEKGVFALCAHGRVTAWFAHERLRDVRPSGSGSSLRRSIALDARLREPTERLLSALEWHGPAMVEFRDDGVAPPCLMEVNGRFWTSLQLAIDAGVDFPNLWVAILRGEAVEPSRRYTEGIALRWLWGDFKRFLYILAGPPQGYPGRYPPVAQGLRELLGRQPPGTRLETWRSADPWPAVGEWVQGFEELLGRG